MNTGNGSNSAPFDNSRTSSLIEYPCDFPIKVMGAHTDDFVHTITEIVRQHDPFFNAATIELRHSQNSKYLGVTVTITATSRKQLDALYLALTSHPLVKVVL